MESVSNNGMIKRSNHGDLKIIMEVISYDINLPGMIVRLETEVVKVNKEVREGLKDKFKMVGMVEAN